MSKLDQMIEEALRKEDRALFEAAGEQGFFGQVGGLFVGRLGWINVATMAAQIALFAGALFAGREFIAAVDPLAAIRWGALAGLLFAAMTVIKLMHWSQMQANRVIREVKRLELLTARGGKS